MPASIVPALLDLFSDTVTLERAGTPNTFGEVTYSAAVSPSPRARIVEKTMQIRNLSGQRVKSSQHIILAGVYNVTILDRITLPDRYPLRTPKIVGTKISTDENGPHHETVYFA
jgi:hypothetical protein